MEGWTDFFAAQLGAAAALTGLIIVGISINVDRILSSPGLPGRAAETLIAPSGLMIVSTLALVPAQPAVVFGVELLAVGLAMSLLPAIIQLRTWRVAQAGKTPFWPRVLLSQLSALPFVAAGALLIAGEPNALYWLVPGVVTALASSILNAWVLLIEILR